MSDAATHPNEPDKGALYGRYQTGEDRRARLASKAAYKALDIPDDDMQIDARKTSTVTGVGTSALIGTALAASALPALLAGALFLRSPTGPAALPAAPIPTAPTPVVVPPAQPTVAPSAPAQPAAPAWDAIYETQNPDGTWTQTRREHLQ